MKQTLLKLLQNKKGRKLFQLHQICCKKDTTFGAARKIFSPSDFMTALKKTKRNFHALYPPRSSWKHCGFSGKKYRTSLHQRQLSVINLALIAQNEAQKHTNKAFKMTFRQPLKDSFYQKHNKKFKKVKDLNKGIKQEAKISYRLTIVRSLASRNSNGPTDATLCLIII